MITGVLCRDVHLPATRDAGKITFQLHVDIILHTKLDGRTVPGSTLHQQRVQRVHARAVSAQKYGQCACKSDVAALHGNAV